MTQGDDQVTEHDANNDEDQGQALGNVQESIAAGRTRRNYVSLVGSLLK